MSDWQPIESAPKDGTFILGYPENGDMRLCRWVNRPTGQSYWLTTGSTISRPTHWQPKPPDPVPYYRDPARWELVDKGLTMPGKVKALLMPGSYHLDWQPTRLEFVIKTLNDWHRETGARVDGLVEFFEAGLEKE